MCYSCRRPSQSVSQSVYFPLYRSLSLSLFAKPNWFHSVFLSTTFLCVCVSFPFFFIIRLVWYMNNPNVGKICIRKIPFLFLTDNETDDIPEQMLVVERKMGNFTLNVKQLRQWSERWGITIYRRGRNSFF